ncbi:LysR family transcriptional regulator [Pectinatus haikarae]|uniref:DNA-binding transcriptional LysR family regulator n=1 Tax=Pectinatus haikarae TaxID=349096 RepID=A0ABT9Y6D0_9FIRM|nr:LysR family transcriptional regulator [Pectinatus haikarae]MDQ0203391.1 DNA-binding transcriptional LysR family regulator [Pectinatus haikarae]
MNIVQMQYFYEVCRWQNITKAAERLHVSQPTVSVAMQSLEAETGLNLFRRNGKKIFISKDGNFLLTRIRPILEEMEYLKHEINDLAHKRNHIRIALPPQIGIRMMPLLLGCFKKEHPEIIVEIIETGPVNSLHMIKDESLDLSIMNYTEEFADGFSYKKLGRAECCFCTYPGSGLDNRCFISVKDIGREPLVLLDSTFNITHLVNQIFARQGIKPNILHYSPYLHTVRNLIEQKIASSFLMKHAVLTGEGIVSLSMETPLYLDTGIVTKKGRQIYADEKILINFLRENFL